MNSSKASSLLALEKRNFYIIIFTLGLGFVITLLPFPSVFTPKAVIMVAITFISAVFWITECVPIALTGLVVILLQALTGIQGISAGLKHIANPVNSIIFAGYIMATALSKYKLDRRISLHIVAAMGQRTDMLFLGVMVATAFLSMWISNSASTAIMMPIALGIVHMTEHEQGKSNLGKIMMIGIAYAANIGGMGTPAGTPASSITIALIRDLTKYEIKFLEWCIHAVPVVLLLVPLGWFILLKLYPPETKRIEGGTEGVKKELEALGPLTSVQRKVLVLFLLAILLWISDSFFPLLPGWLYIASVVIALLFVLPKVGVVTWKESAPEIGWDIFILVGGGLALGSGLNETGVIKIIAEALATGLKGTGIYIVAGSIALITSLSITVFSSLTATATTFVPVTVGLALALGFNPVPLGIMAGLASCCAFMLPANTPPNAIVYKSEYFKSYEMAKAGIVFILGSAILLAVIFSAVWL
ncbi:MAG: DASS family sodium-coupled anion symporter [Spirochaetales bacterium]